MGLGSWFKGYRQRRKQKKLQKAMQQGKAPHGRTAPAEKPAETPPSMGGGVIKVSTSLTARHLRLNPSTGQREEVDRREVKDRVVTTAFVEYLVDNLIAEVAAFGDFKYHDSGTGTGNEAAGDTGLGTPTGIARATGTQEEGASTNIYKSVATITYDGSYAVTEHGLFNASSSGTLMDRTKFAAINVSDTDEIEFTFTITFAAGS